MGIGHVRFEPWGRGDLHRLFALVTEALPEEGLTADELQAHCWDDPDPGIVLGAVDDTAAVAGVIRSGPAHPAGHVRLVAVAPGSRRGGLGRAAV
ncbi:MAG: GNAT family N-acetyltransferase, partial [Acidimicrobiales bacterium]